MFRAVRLSPQWRIRISAGVSLIAFVAAGVFPIPETSAEPPVTAFPADSQTFAGVPAKEIPPVPPAVPSTSDADDGSLPPQTSAGDRSPTLLEQERASKDPFSRPPSDLLRSLSEVRVELDSPAADTLGEAEFKKRGQLTLAPHAWPRCTPEAAAYRFSSAPLWYEDANLERCGHSCGCVQPLISGAYFFGNTATLPYRLVAESQCRTVPAKSFCPPGYRYSCVENYFPEPDAAGGVAQAAAITGLIFLIP